MRRIVTAGAVLAVVLTTLVVGPGIPDAKAGAANCTDGWPTTTPVPTGGVGYAAVETLVSPSYVFVGACLADKPLGTQSLVFSGFVGVHARNVGPDTWNVWIECDGDGTTLALVTANCNVQSTVTATPSTSPGAGFTASAVNTVEGITLSLLTTGANTGGLSTSAGSTPTVTYGGTCATVAGITPPLVTSCTMGAVDTKTSTSDLTPGSGPGGTALCFVRDSSGNCLAGVPKACAVVFKDGANPTEVSVLGIKVLNDPGPLFVGLC